MSDDSSSRPNDSDQPIRNQVKSNGVPVQSYLASLGDKNVGQVDYPLANAVNQHSNTANGTSNNHGNSPKPNKTPWGPVASIFYTVLVAFFGAQLVAGFAVVTWGKLFLNSDTASSVWLDTITGQFVYSLVAELLMILLIAMYIRAKNGTFAMLGLHKLQLRYMLYGVLGFVAYIIMYLLLATVLGTLVPQLDNGQKQDLGFGDPSVAADYIMLFISLVILPPIAEEILFRGFMYSGLRTKMRFLPTAIITSIIFAIGHLQIGNDAPLLWTAAVDTFVLSMVMCYIREKTGSIWPTIIIHMLKNGLAFLLLYIVVDSV